MKQGLEVGDDGQGQVLLGAEEVVQAPPVDAGGLGHRVEGGGAEALVVGEVGGGEDDPLPRRPALFFLLRPHPSVRNIHRHAPLPLPVFLFAPDSPSRAEFSFPGQGECPGQPGVIALPAGGPTQMPGGPTQMPGGHIQMPGGHIRWVGRTRGPETSACGKYRAV